MPTRKRKTKSGISWGFYFDAQGSTRVKRISITAWGFPSKKAAQTAELKRRIEEQARAETPAGVTAPVPKTLRTLLDEFCREYGDRNLSPKTVSRYRQLGTYLSQELLAMPIEDVSPVHLTREWNRIHESGGHFRKTKAARPLSVKTVRSIAGFVSSAFSQAVAWGLARSNPAMASRKPRGGERRVAVALSAEQQHELLGASKHWLLPSLLELCAGLGARRGEVLALRWADIAGDQVVIGRSLSQANGHLVFKEPKTLAGFRTITIPVSTKIVLDEHRQTQEKCRRQFGPDYRADLDLVFCNPDGSPVRPDSISSAVSALCRRLKLPPGVSLHALRHTHGSHLLAGGMELPAVSARLGHSSTHVTAKVYAHVLDGRDRQAAVVWESLRRPPASETARSQHHEEMWEKKA